MASEISTDAAPLASAERPESLGGELVKRHRAFTRLWHWTNAVAIIVLLMSGMMISNAHPMLYWGHYGANFDQPWLHVPRFPGWLTIPSSYNLALARHWHLFFAWIFAFGFLAYLIVGLFNRHLRDLTLRASELHPRHLWDEVKHHAQLRFPTGAAALKYNTLQKLAYMGVLYLLVPMMILTGMILSPGLAPVTALPMELLGGRSSARSLHFLAAAGIAAFIAVHLALVVLAGPFNEIRSMVTGWFQVPTERVKAMAEEQGYDAAQTGELA